MNKKIIVIGNNSNGMFLFREMLISELVKKGNDVVVLTPFDLNVKDIENLGVKMIETPIDRRGINPINDYSLYRQYKKILCSENPDFVITYTIKPNIYAGFLCRKKRIPYAVNITGLGTAFQHDGLLRSLVTIMYKKALTKAKVVFFENEGNRQLFVNEKICTNSQSELLYGAGVDIEKYYLSDYPQNEPVRFLFMGRVMKEKGVDELFRATQKLFFDVGNIELFVLGRCEENYKPIIDKYETEGWLKYFEYQEDVRPFIEQVHCFVLPSWHEGMANTNLECAAMGRPVITSSIHGCMEAVEDGVSGYLCKKQDADDLYKKMKQFMMLSYEERKSMGLAGRKHMEEYFDKRKVVEKTIARL